MDLTEAASELASEQKVQGNINELKFQTQLNEYLEAKILLYKSQLEVVRLTEKMNQLLGISFFETCWIISAELPPILEEELSFCCLEEIALSERLDLQVSIWEIERLARMFGIKQWWAYTDAYFGGSYEKMQKASKSEEPVLPLHFLSLIMGRPIELACKHYLCKASIFTMQKIEILAEVRSLHEQLMIQRALVLNYETQILPLQNRFCRFQKLLPFYGHECLSISPEEKARVTKQIHYTEELRNYWMIKVAMYKSLGTMKVME